MSILIYTPYTYLIGWTKQNIWYYGVRFGKNCHPNDLWNPYKTSSKYVKEFIELHGDPDVIQIRKTFKDGESAQIWEERVLTKINVVERKDFLNKTHTNRIKSEAIRNGLKKYWNSLSKEERSIRSKNSIEAMNNSPRKPVDPELKSQWVKNYWYSMTLEERSKINEKSRLGSINYNKSLSQEEKSIRGKNAVNSVPITICPHCGKSGKKGNMNRWHFNNCKLNPQ